MWFRSPTMLLLKIVTTAAAHHASLTAGERAVLHGTVILHRLLDPSIGSERIVCAASYFASVGAAEDLQRWGIGFIGTVKTAHRRFPLASLSPPELRSRGAHVTMVHSDASGKTDMMVVMWLDRDRRYFLSTTGSSQA